MPDLPDGADDVFGIAVTVALTFALGLEREESGARRHAGGDSAGIAQSGITRFHFQSVSRSGGW